LLAMGRELKVPVDVIIIIISIHPCLCGNKGSGEHTNEKKKMHKFSD
jgi:hypothetical protein